MKKYFHFKNIIIGKIDKNHPQSEKINKTVEETFTTVSKMINEISSLLTPSVINHILTGYVGYAPR